jgi:uncharacterized OsmC-like protein
MPFVLRTVLIGLVVASVFACTSYTGDSLLKHTEQPVPYVQQRIIAKAQQGVVDMLLTGRISQQ